MIAFLVTVTLWEAKYIGVNVIPQQFKDKIRSTHVILSLVIKAIYNNIICPEFLSIRKGKKFIMKVLSLQN